MLAPDLHPGAGTRGVAAAGVLQHGAAQCLVQFLEALEVPLVVHPHLSRSVTSETARVSSCFCMDVCVLFPIPTPIPKEA